LAGQAIDIVLRKATLAPMPQLSLSWDLFIVVFFAIVMSYSFIIGKHQSMKVIIASYIAIIATQGIGNVLTRLMGGSEAMLQSMGIPMDDTLIALAKIFLFALCVIMFVIRSGIDVSYEHDSGTILSDKKKAIKNDIKSNASPKKVRPIPSTTKNIKQTIIKTSTIFICGYYTPVLIKNLKEDEKKTK
jgi:hypothetical protein